MSSTKNIDWDILKELKCPVCLEYMASPIRMCKNGHNICNSCRLRVSKCPSCKGQFIDTRNISLEKIATTAAYPCHNRGGGCMEIFTMQDRRKHLVCRDEKIECPFKLTSGTDCRWTGTLADIVGHVRSEHSSETTEVAKHFKVTLLNFSKERQFRQAVCILGKLFYLVWETDADSLRFAVFHLGLKDVYKDFKYGIKIGNSEDYISKTSECHSYLEGTIKDLESEKCVRIDYDAVQKYVSKHGDLSCEIKIGKERFKEFLLEEMRESYPAVSDIYNTKYKGVPLHVQQAKRRGRRTAVDPYYTSALERRPLVKLLVLYHWDLHRVPLYRRLGGPRGPGLEGFE